MTKYDLITAEDQSRAVIIDWKTGRNALTRLHSNAVYRLRSTSMCWSRPIRACPGALSPEQAEMRYWFVAAPEHPITFRYDAAQHEANRNASPPSSAKS